MVLDLLLGQVLHLHENIRMMVCIALLGVVFAKRIIGCVNNPVILIVLVVLSIVVFPVVHLGVLLLKFKVNDNTYLESDIDETTNRINDYVEKNKLHAARREARHLLNLYKACFGEFSRERENLRQVLSRKLQKEMK